MGLDIYFYLRNKDDEKKEQREKVLNELNELYNLPQEEFEKECDKIDELQELANELDTKQEIAYFRKVNFLLPFFGYEENCSYIPISKCEIEDLIDTCVKVLDNNDLAKELLPNTQGFFFGSDEYDDYYFNDVIDVMSKFEVILDNFDFDRYDLLMHCWW